MRIRTVALLALAGMGTTSFGTWELTEPDTPPGDPPRTDAPPTAAAGPGAEATVAADQAHFTQDGPLTLEGRLGHAVLPSDRSESTYLYATITAPEQAVSERPPLDLAVVVDTSGSMRGSRLDNAIAAARGMIDRLDQRDRVTVVTYARTAEVPVPITSVTPEARARVARALGDITANSATCISCGLNRAFGMLGPEQPGRVRRILLLSDGEATEGERTEAGFANMAQIFRASGASVSTVGVDIEYDERILGTLAQMSNGQHYFVQNPSGLPPVFERELSTLARTVASDVELVVDLEPGVQIERVFDRDVQRVGNRLVVPIGTVDPDEPRTLLVQVRVDPAASERRAIARIGLSYLSLANNAREAADGALTASTTDDPSSVSALDPVVSARLSRAVANLGLRDANDLTRQGRFEEAQRRLRDATAQVDDLEHGARGRGPMRLRRRSAREFGGSRRALNGALGGLSDPSLVGPSPRPAAPVRRQVATQQRRNADLMNPF